MRLITQTPKKALKAFLKQRPLESERDLFKTNLIALLDKIAVIEKMPKEESEEHLKNDIRDFLLNIYYKETNAINTKDKKDLVIYETKQANSDALVIIEAKRPSNTNEMLTAEKPNRKALQELILYYLNERQAGNFKLKNLIATNIYEWFIIDANQFDKYIYNDKKIRELHSTKANDKKTTPFFYDEVAKMIDTIDAEIPCIHFDIRDYENILRNTKKEDDKELVALYKILSPQHLLKIATPNDSNTLNEKFYKELLHIIGLEEAKEGGKYIIRRKEKDRNAVSLIELAIEALQTEDTFHRIPDIKVYGEDKTEQTFNIALELCITWINRILFLKLLEGQLVSYQSSSDYKFLNSKTIHDFDELFKLFHRVLAVNIAERTDAIKTKYSRVPYLNSSLFEISDLEDQTIKINSLANDGLLQLISTTVLKDTKKKTDKLPTLEYLFLFLDSYDFASEGTEDWQKDNRPLINASVLGKVFEKINGYKDGSIFTPAFITMYMCRQSIRLAVTEKFNEVLSDKGKKLFDKFDDIKNYTTKLFKTDEVLKANAIINSLHICDPAVGSGHFLVSALNELIVVKAELGILADEKGNTIGGYEFEVLNDELTIVDTKGNSIEYKLQNGKPSKEIQRLQKTLFYEKQTIIENCLFGVDINLKSVLICRLRLWIELLKNAYYKESGFTELETLPNIDINIKCGNSLLSRFALDADLSKALKSIKYDVKAYRGFVNDYKNEKNRDAKRGLQKIIDIIKSDFRTEIGKNDPKQIRLNKISGELFNLLNQTKMFELDAKQKKAQREKKEKLEAEINKLSKEIDEIKTNALYKNAFEWRFEFPEVLNNDGEFEGFDVVIANPPYIFGGNEGISDSHKNYFKENYKSGSGKINLFNLFIEKGFGILKQKGELAFIIPNTFLRVTSYHESRKFLIDNFQINAIADFGANVFEEATTTAIVLSATKVSPPENSTIVISNGETITNKLLQSALRLNYVIALNINAEGQGVTNKIRNESVPLGEICKELIFGVVITKNKDEVVSNAPMKGWKPFIEGKDISRYYVKPIYQYLNYQPELLHRARTKEVFESKEKLLIQRITGGSQPLKVAYDNKQLYNKESINNLILNDEALFNIKFILSLLNSKLINWFYNSQFTNESTLTVNISKEYLSQIPIKNIPLKEQKPFIDLVDKILATKENGKDSSDYEKKIDELVYKLYDITPDEQKIIEGK